MQIAGTIAQARALFDVLPRPLGFVPTMGALHEGHLALVRRARAESITVAASVFVNPLQFAANEDLERYPRDLEGDRAKLAQAGVDVLFAPSAIAMYPPDFSTSIDVGPMGGVFEGDVRPGHFAGVATVVCKLLNVVRPDMLYLGQKDAQQTAVLRKMIADLEIPTGVTIVPTEREADGLAMSSRNLYLSPQERKPRPRCITRCRPCGSQWPWGDPRATRLPQRVRDCIRSRNSITSTWWMPARSIRSTRSRHQRS